jgi:hypothetical protein
MPLIKIFCKGSMKGLFHQAGLRIATATAMLACGMCGVCSAQDTNAWDALDDFFQPPSSLAGQMGNYKSPLIFANGQAVTTPEDWLHRRQEILDHWHAVMGAWPPLLAQPTLEIVDSHERENFTQHRVRVQIAADQTVEGYLLEPRGSGPFPGVVVPYYEPETSIGLGQPFRDFGYQLARRGFVTLSIGSPGGDAREPALGGATCQPLSYLAFIAANCHTVLARRGNVDAGRIGIVGHSYGGKWAMFASCLYDKFACAAWSDPGIVFDETRSNVNYWERWYLGAEPGRRRSPGIPGVDNPRTGASKVLMDSGGDLHELHALMAPRPCLVSGGAEDGLERGSALNHSIAVYRVLGQAGRVGMTNREGHTPTAESNGQLYLFIEHCLNRTH